MAAGQAPKPSGMVDQQAFARQGQGHRGVLEERLRRGGVVQQQKDFSGSLPQLLQAFRGDDVVRGGVHRVRKLGQAVPLDHENVAPGVIFQGGPVFKLFDRPHDEQVLGGGHPLDVFARGLVAHQGSKDHHGLEGEPGYGHGQDAVGGHRQAGPAEPGGQDPRQGYRRNEPGGPPGQGRDEADHAAELPAVVHADLFQVGQQHQERQPQQAQGQQGPRDDPVFRGVQIPLDPPSQNQGQGRQGRQGIIFDAAGRQGEKAQDDRSPDEQQPPGGPHFPAGSGGLPEPVEGFRQDEGPGHQPDAQKHVEPGEGEGVDVGRGSPAQEPHDLFVDDLKLEKAGIGQLRRHPPGNQQDGCQAEPPGREQQVQETALLNLPGIEQADQTGKDYPDETLAEKPGHQGQKEQGRPAPVRLGLPAQQTIERRQQ